MKIMIIIINTGAILIINSFKTILASTGVVCQSIHTCGIGPTINCCTFINFYNNNKFLFIFLHLSSVFVFSSFFVSCFLLCCFLLSSFVFFFISSFCTCAKCTITIISRRTGARERAFIVQTCCNITTITQSSYTFIHIFH